MADGAQIAPLRRHDEILTTEQHDAISDVLKAFSVFHTAKAGFPVVIHAYEGEWTEIEVGGRRFQRKRQSK